MELSSNYWLGGSGQGADKWGQFLDQGLFISASTRVSPCIGYPRCVTNDPST